MHFQVQPSADAAPAGKACPLPPKAAHLPVTHAPRHRLLRSRRRQSELPLPLQARRLCASSLPICPDQTQLNRTALTPIPSRRKPVHPCAGLFRLQRPTPFGLSDRGESACAALCGSWLHKQQGTVLDVSKAASFCLDPMITCELSSRRERFASRFGERSGSALYQVSGRQQH